MKTTYLLLIVCSICFFADTAFGVPIAIPVTTITGNPNELANGLDGTLYHYTVNPNGTLTPNAAFTVNNILTNTGYQFNPVNIGSFVSNTTSGTVAYGAPGVSYSDNIPLTSFLDGGTSTISGDALTLSYTNNELSYPNNLVFNIPGNGTGTLLYFAGYTYITPALVGTTITYSMASDDGAELIINGATVINNPGIHGATTSTQTAIYSAAGLYPIEIGYYDGHQTRAQFTFSFSGGTIVYPNVFTTVNAGLNQSWSNINNWTSAVNPNNAFPNGINNIANLGPVSTPSSVDLGGNSYTVNQLNVLSGGSAGWTVKNGTLFFDGTNPVYTDQSSTGGNVVSVAIGLNQNTEFNIGATGGTNITGAISNGFNGPAGITKTGAGTLTLSGTNTYTGATNLNAGTLNVGSAGALSSGTTLSFNGGTLQYSAANQQDYSNQFNTGTGQLYSIDTNGQNVTFASNLPSNGGSLTKLGNGTLTLTGNNTYTNGTAVNGGVLSVSSDNNLGATSGGISLSGGELLTTSTLNTARSVMLGTGADSLAASTSTTATYSGQVSGSGPLIIGDAMGDNGKVILTNTSNNYTGGTTIASGSTLQVGDGATSNGSIGSGTVTDNGVFMLDPATVSIVSNPIVGTGSVTKSGNGISILNNNNTYSGGTNITGGTLVAATSSAFGIGNVVNSGGVIETDGINHRINIGGNFQQSSSGILALSFDNTSYDTVHVTGAGNSVVDGTLAINFAGLTAPKTLLGQVHTTFTYTLVSTVDGLTHDVTFDPLNLAGGINPFLTYDPNDIFLNIMSMGGPGTFSLTGLTPNQTSVGNYINASLLSGKTDPLIELLGAEVTDNPAALGTYLDQLNPIKFENFAGATAFNDDDFLIQEMDNYLAGMRSVDGTFISKAGLDTSGLAVNDATNDPALQDLRSRLASLPSGGSYANQFGAANSKDLKDLQPVEVPYNQWNTVIAGNVSLAQTFSDANTGIAHSDATSEALIFGEDYRWTPHVVSGVFFNYQHTSASLDDIGSDASVETYAPGFYASYSDKGWYANLLGKYGFNDYSQRRAIALPGVGEATSHPSGYEAMINLDSGYDFHLGNWTVGPSYGVHYTHLDINGYQENGLVSGDLNVQDSQGDSFKSRIGGRARYEFHSCGVTFTPHASVSWQHEFMNQLQSVNSQFADLRPGTFNVQTPRICRDSALMDLGLDAEINRSISVFGAYYMNAGLNDYFAHNVQVGVKLSF